jgi:hypothetical protein
MATQAYWDWKARGSPFTVARPIADMVSIARRHGIGVLGTIGNEDHLTADPPEDHTPFSETAYPIPVKDCVCACDLVNAQGLGDALLRDARAGKTPWLKYMNFGNRQYGHWDGFRSWTWNSDDHLHISCFSDKILYSLGSYDPLSTEEDMEQSERLINKTGRVGRTVADALGDTLALRDYLIGDGWSLPADTYPRPGSPLAKMMAPATFTDEQLEEVADKVAKRLEVKLPTLEQLEPLFELARRLKE